MEKIKEQLSTNADLRLLQNCPFLLINPGNRVRTLADEMFEEAQITPNIILETENIETVLALAAKGMGITFYPKMFISSHEVFQNNLENKTGLNFYSLNYPKAHGILGIGYHKGHPRQPKYSFGLLKKPCNLYHFSTYLLTSFELLL